MVWALPIAGAKLTRAQVIRWIFNPPPTTSPRKNKETGKKGKVFLSQSQAIPTTELSSLFMDEVLTAHDATSSSTTPPAISTNLPLISACLAFAIAQFLKLFTTWYKENRWDSKRLLGSGGMPSSHSATVAALSVAVALQDGAGSSAFAISIVLAAIVMYDASGIRLHAGRQAEILNQIVCEFPEEHPLSNSRPLRELLGHTPLQVVVGSILGCFVSFLMRNSV